MAKTKRVVTNESALLAETHRVNYRLRSTFFYRKLKEYGTLSLPATVKSLLQLEQLYNWDNRHEWGVGDDAFGFISQHPQLHLLEVFCHPKLLREYPQLLAYYRNIAALSQKSVGYLVGIDGSRFESATSSRASIASDQALKLAALFNEHLSLIVDASIQSFTTEELYGLLLVSTGAQIDGSWRNAIGEEAEKVTQRLLVNEARERHLLAALIPRTGASEPFDLANIDEQLGNIHQYRGIQLSNQTSMLFASDPDIALIDKNGVTVCAIEVKGGADPAGALERYGAAKKSFEAARRVSANVPTVLIASCITAEVHARIEQDPVISSYYNLTELLNEESAAYDEFMQEVFTILGV